MIIIQNCPNTKEKCITHLPHPKFYKREGNYLPCPFPLNTTPLHLSYENKYLGGIVVYL